MRIREIPGCPGVYEVDSMTRTRKPYEVDLFELKGNGVCQCVDFDTRCRPNYRENGGKIVDYGTTEKKNKNRTYCRHIKLARWVFLNKLLAELYCLYRQPEQG